MRAPVSVILLASANTVFAADSSAVRLRTTPEMFRCVERAVGPGVVVEEGDPAVTTDADIIVGAEAGLVRMLEGGSADARSVVDLGMGLSKERRPSMIIAALVADSRRARDAQQVLARLQSREARQAFAACAGVPDVRAFGVTQAGEMKPGLARFATAVSDWWLPVCSQSRNIFNETGEVLGAPNAVALGGKDNYRGFMSLGQGGWVVVDMGQTIQNGPGNDIRVYQSQADEAVTLYAGDSANGVFRQVAFRRYCGNRMPGLFSSFCDFDLAEAGIGSARYLRVEDGELYPCLRGGTASEGADIDAVELLNP
jgi:hypothetical protein